MHDRGGLKSGVHASALTTLPPPPSMDIERLAPAASAAGAPLDAFDAVLRRLQQPHCLRIARSCGSTLPSARRTDAPTLRRTSPPAPLADFSVAPSWSNQQHPPSASCIPLAHPSLQRIPPSRASLIHTVPRPSTPLRPRNRLRRITAVIACFAPSSLDVDVAIPRLEGVMRKVPLLDKVIANLPPACTTYGRPPARRQAPSVRPSALPTRRAHS